MITLEKIKQKYSATSFQVDMKMDCCEREKRGPKKSFLAVKLDVHMTNFKGCQNKKKKRRGGGGEEKKGLEKNTFTS